MRHWNPLTGIRPVVLTTTIALLVSGCATLNKSECTTGNWSVIGQSDGASGKVISDQLKAHNKACSKHGISVDQDTYMLGYNEGIASYCTTESGYNVGTKFGKSVYNRNAYKDVCPDDQELSFLEGYINALKLNLELVHSELAEEKNELDSNRGALLILKALNSSKADRMEEEVEEGDDSVSEKQAVINDTIKEIEKWMTARPELQSMVDG